MSKGDKKTGRRKKKWIRIAIPIAVVLVVVLFIKNSMKGATAAIPVYTQAVSVGDIDTELSVSGKVMAEEATTFFAPANAKVEAIEVTKGDVVKAGDVLLCFDKEAVAYAKQQSELQGKISSADYNSNIQSNNEQKTKLAQAEADIAECEAAIDNYEKYIDDLTNGITDITALKKSDLYAKIYSVQKEMNAYDLALQMPDEDTDVEMLMRKKVEKQNELNKLNNDLNLLSDYKTDYGWEDMLTQAKKDLADYQERLAEAKSTKAGAESAVVNGNKLAGYQLNKEKSELESADAEKKYEEALNGVVAGFNGVVSELNVVEGATVQEGAQLMVLESFDNVCVEFQASKYALETLAVGQPAEIIISGKTYSGTVSKINHVAEANSSGTPMVAARVHIDNPDENIFLGIEAKLKILTAREQGVLQVPVEAVNVDSQGEFCYLNENGILAKKYIKTGISSETYIQISDGLSENQEIVTSSAYGMALEEGMPVMAMPGRGMASPVTESTPASQEQTETETQTEARQTMARIIEYVKIALMNIRSNKGRSFLTMLGIIIGISSVILIVSAGNGFKVGISGQLDELVGGYVQFYADVPSDEADSILFTNDDLDMILEKVPHVKGATDVWNFGSQATAQSTKGTFSVSPMFGNESLLYFDTAPIIRGRYYNKSEAQSAAKVCVISERGAKKMFGSTDVIGMDVNMSLWGITEDFTIVGIRKDNDSLAKQMTTGTSADVSMEIPLTTLEALYGYYTDEFSSFIVFADSSEYVTEISRQVKSLLEARYNVRGKEYIQAYDMASQVGMISDILNYVTIFIMLVAGIALIVGGIGVMNIMLVSVTERTKEIGIRKALGAKTGSILFQFLMEAVIITLIGGFVGIILGVLGAKGICGIAASMGMAGMEAVIDPKVVLAATGFSSLIGIFFGIYPARKAAKLSPIEALRHE